MLEIREAYPGISDKYFCLKYTSVSAQQKFPSCLIRLQRGRAHVLPYNIFPSQINPTALVSVLPYKDIVGYTEL